MSESRKKEDEVRQEDSVSNYDDCYVNSVLSMTSGCKHVCDCLRHHHNSSPYELNFRYGLSIILESGDYKCCTKRISNICIDGFKNIPVNRATAQAGAPQTGAAQAQFF